MVHTMKTVTVTGTARTPRRQHERSFKAELVEQCLVPGASVAAIALAGGINANLLFKWRSEHLRSTRPTHTTSSSAVLIPVHVAPNVDGEGDGRSQQLKASAASPPIAVANQRAVRSGVIELDFAGAVLRLRGPVDETSLCGVLRALRQST
jgi:transposase